MAASFRRARAGWRRSRPRGGHSRVPAGCLPARGSTGRRGERGAGVSSRGANAPRKTVRQTLRSLLRWPQRATPCLLVAAPAIGLFLLIREHRVNIPFLDDWMFVHMFEKEKAGTLALSDFFMVQMEHRMAFVRALIMVFHKLWPTDYTMQMFLTWAFLVATWGNVALLLKRTTGAGFHALWPLLTLTGLVIFSPVQYRIVLWAMMFQVACPALFLSTALVALLSRWKPWARWTVVVLCASCATQCFASGILVWLLPLPLVWWGGTLADRKARAWFTGLLLAAFAVTMGLYFRNLTNEVEPAFAYKQGEEDTLRRDVKGFFTAPGKSAPYVLRFLGSHLARGSSVSLMDASLLIGGISLALYLGAAGWCVANWRREDLRVRLLPWLAFGAYSIGTGSMVAMGRMWASRSGNNAVTARYVIHAAPLTVALIALAWIIARDWLGRRQNQHRPLERALPVATTALLSLQLLSWVHGWRLMEVWESSRLRGAVNTMFFKTASQLDDVVPANRELARRADDLGLLDPPMLQDSMLDHFKRVPKMLSTNTARLMDLDVEVDDEGYHVVAEGFACLATRERVADGIFLTRRLPREERWEILRVAQVTGMPLYLLETFSKDSQFVHMPSNTSGKEGLAGFSGRCHLEQLPRGVHDIMAWAYDARRRLVYPIPGFFELDTRGERPRVKRLGNDPKSVRLDKFLRRGK
jgi:hypothetical protein